LILYPLSFPLASTLTAYHLACFLFPGSVGSIVVQLAKSIPDTKVIAVAGGADKCQWVRDVLGADHALDYKAEGFAKDFRKLLKDSGYADCVFENVGGELLDLVSS